MRRGRGDGADGDRAGRGAGDADQEQARRKAWRFLVGMQVGAVALVGLALLAVWLIGMYGDQFGHR